MVDKGKNRENRGICGRHTSGMQAILLWVCVVNRSGILMCGIIKCEMTNDNLLYSGIYRGFQ